MGGGKGKSKAPKAPDYTSLANTQAQLDRQTASEQTMANRVNQLTPYGNSLWIKHLPETGGEVWQQNINFTPQQQAIFDAEQRNMLSLQNLGSNAITQAGQTMGQAFNPSLVDFATPGQWQGSNTGLPQTTLGGLQDIQEGSGAFQKQNQEVRDALYNQLTRFNEERYGKLDESTRSRLLASGLQEGSAAYNNAMRELDRSRTEAYDSAGIQSILAGGQEQSRLFADQLAGRASNIGLRQGQFAQGMDLFGADQSERNLASNYGLNLAQTVAGQRGQQFNEQSYMRSLPLNEISALLSGSGVQMPQFAATPQVTPYGSADILGAAQAGYGARMGSYNAGQQQKGSLLGAGAGLLGGYLGGK